jgi:A/G-specific adenine glycosylase
MDWKEIGKPLLKWYEKEARILPWREEPTAYRVWISEIMLQQTRVEAVKPYFQRFLERIPDVKTLAFVQEDVLMKLWEGLGYYNRARNLQKAAKIIMEEYQGEIPKEYSLLLKLPGIGEYTAGAIASIAYDLPYPAVDGNVIRVLSRILGEERVCTQPMVKKELTQKVQVILSNHSPRQLNQALMELGAAICLPNGMPLCPKCPIREACYAYFENRVLDFPVKSEKKNRVLEKRNVFFIEKDGKVCIRKRESRGLLKGLWELPNNIEAEDSNVFAYLKELGILEANIENLGKAKHIFTHIQWDMDCYYVEVIKIDDMQEDILWVSLEELQKDYAMPTAFKQCLKKGITFLNKKQRHF